MSGQSMINIRNMSIKCGHCNTYQTLCAFKVQDDGWNVYVYECENDICDPAVTRTLLEVPMELDEFARRDPGWRGGRRHAGAEPDPEASDGDFEGGDFEGGDSEGGDSEGGDSEGGDSERTSADT